METAEDEFSASLSEHILDHPDSAHCKEIPAGVARPDKKQLCALDVVEYEPVYVTKATFFIKDEQGDIKVINKLLDNGNSSFSHFNFSENGKYLYITFTDEGHAYFVSLIP